MSVNKTMAADGKTEVHHLNGVGLVVSAVEFNGLVGRNAELAKQLAAEQENHAQLQARCFDNGGTFSSVFGEVVQLRIELAAAQAKIDELMIEFCPEDITPERWVEYQKHQKPVTEAVAAA